METKSKNFNDDFSRYSTMYFMAFEVISIVNYNIFNRVVQPSNVTGFTLRSANGGEDISRKFQKFRKTKSIAQQLTSPFSALQKVIADLYWQMIFDKARALLLTSERYPKIFW